MPSPIQSVLHMSPFTRAAISCLKLIENRQVEILGGSLLNIHCRLSDQLDTGDLSSWWRIPCRTERKKHGKRNWTRRVHCQVKGYRFWNAIRARCGDVEFHNEIRSCRWFGLQSRFVELPVRAWLKASVRVLQGKGKWGWWTWTRVIYKTGRQNAVRNVTLVPL